MKEGYENILERQRIVEEKMGEIVQQFEYSAEVFEHIVPCTSQVNPQAPAGYYGGGGGFYDAGEYWGEDDY